MRQGKILTEDEKKELVQRTLSILWKVPLYDIEGQREVLRGMVKEIEEGKE